MKNTNLTDTVTTTRITSYVYFSACFILLAIAALVFTFYRFLPPAPFLPLSLMVGVGLIHGLQGRHSWILSKWLEDNSLSFAAQVRESMQRTRRSTRQLSAILIAATGLLPLSIGAIAFFSGALDNNPHDVYKLGIVGLSTCACGLVAQAAFDLSGRITKRLENHQTPLHHQEK